MNQRHFEMRLSCTYTDPDNSIDQLDIEVLINGAWQTLDLNTRSPGFQLFNYGLFSCQHLYFRINAAERGLMLGSAKGHITVETDIDWNIRSLQVEFNGMLKSGSPSEDDIAYIIERMGFCPVSSNMKDITDSRRDVRFESAAAHQG